MMPTPRIAAGVGALIVALSANSGSAQTFRTFSVSRPVASERFLHVTLDFSAGSMALVPSNGELFALKMRYDPERSTPLQQYDPRTGILRIGMTSNGGFGMRVSSRSQAEQTARFEFSPDVPLVLSANVAAGNSTLDLGGMTLNQLDVHATASHATIDFSRPNRGPCKSATFSVGASELTVLHLAQSGCGVVRVDGGVGSVSLGFDGEWQRDVALTVDMAMGGLKLQVPRGTGVRVTANRFLAPFNGKGFVRNGDTWTTPGFEDAPHKLRVELKAAMVGIDVNWSN